MNSLNKRKVEERARTHTHTQNTHIVACDTSRASLMSCIGLAVDIDWFCQPLLCYSTSLLLVVPILVLMLGFLLCYWKSLVPDLGTCDHHSPARVWQSLSRENGRGASWLREELPLVEHQGNSNAVMLKANKHSESEETTRQGR